MRIALSGLLLLLLLLSLCGVSSLWWWHHWLLWCPWVSIGRVSALLVLLLLCWSRW